MLRYMSPYIVRFYSSKNTIPFKVYLDLADVKTIYKENNRKSGIYRWVNLINGSTYIGSAADLTRRLRDYFSPAPASKFFLLLKNAFFNNKKNKAQLSLRAQG